MNKINFSEPETDSWKKWRQKCELETQKLVDLVNAGKKPAISALYKKQKAFFRSKDGPFRGKCAYCDQKIFGNQHGDIEHYRPKKAVQNEDGSPVEVTIQGKKQKHPGYFWLAYEWKNLLFGCGLCNQMSAEKSGKGTRFPVFGQHAVSPGAEATEKPKLIHPCIDDPTEHIAFDATGAAIWKTERGQVTIKVLGLNERGLPDERGRAYQDAKTRFDYVFSARPHKGAAWVGAELKRLREDSTAEFYAVTKAAYKEAAQDVLKCLGQ